MPAVPGRFLRFRNGAVEHETRLSTPSPASQPWKNTESQPLTEPAPSLF
jgi:hypothetical protein